MEAQVIEVNGDRYVNVRELLQAVCAIREQSMTRKQALRYIVENIRCCEEIPLNETMSVKR